MWTYNTLIVLAGACLLGALCGLIGSFAVLRRRALLGDALAHATLPGIALIFLITGVRSLPVLLVGALATGLFGAWALSYIRRNTRTKDDAALGIILSVLFGAGVALSRYVQNTVPGGSKAGLDNYIYGKAAGIVMSDVLLIAAIAAVAIALIIALYKEFRLISFDPDFAQAAGLPVAALDLAMMALLACAVVVGLPMVGVVMVAALLIVPAVAARLWTEKLSVMLILAVFFAILSTGTGALLSAAYSNMPTGPMMALTAGVLFVVSAIFAPARGILARWLKERAAQTRAGAHVLIRELSDRPVAAPQLRPVMAMIGVVSGGRSLRLALSKRWIEIAGGVAEATPDGIRELVSAWAPPAEIAEEPEYSTA